MTSFAIAVALAAWLRSLDLSWLIYLPAAGIICAIPPFVISQVYAAFGPTNGRNARAGRLDGSVTPEEIRQEPKRFRAAGHEALAQDWERAAATIEREERESGPDSA